MTRTVTRRAVAVLAAVAALALARPGRAVPASEIMDRAREAAAHEHWNDAARALEEIVAAGIDSTDVLYDLGTVYARAGRYGEAIWRLEQVNRRRPFAGDAQQNLRASRLRLAHRDAGRTGRAVVETANSWSIALAELLPRDWAVMLTVLCELLALGGWLQWRRRSAGEVARVTGAAGAIVLVGASLFFGSIVIARQFDPSSAIALRDGLHLLREPSADAIAEGPVREGERLEVLGHDSVFVRVRVPGGPVGWLALRDLGRLDE